MKAAMNTGDDSGSCPFECPKAGNLGGFVMSKDSDTNHEDVKISMSCGDGVDRHCSAVHHCVVLPQPEPAGHASCAAESDDTWYRWDDGFTAACVWTVSGQTLCDAIVELLRRGAPFCGDAGIGKGGDPLPTLDRGAIVTIISKENGQMSATSCVIGGICETRIPDCVVLLTGQSRCSA